MKLNLSISMVYLALEAEQRNKKKGVLLKTVKLKKKLM